MRGRGSWQRNSSGGNNAQHHLLKGRKDSSKDSSRQIPYDQSCCLLSNIIAEYKAAGAQRFKLYQHSGPALEAVWDKDFILFNVTLVLISSYSP